MIIEINNESINELDNLINTIVDKNYLKNEFNNNNFFKVLINIKDNEIIGYLYYYEIYERIEIEYIFTKKEYRRQKIASELLTKIVDKNKPTTLEVDKENIPAICLYKKYNFKNYAIRRNYYKNGHDAYLFGLEKKMI